MGIFKDKKKGEAQMASAPEGPETPGEIKHIEDLGKSEPVQEKEEKEEKEEAALNYRERLVCASQEEINTLVIENNMMLKQILSSM